MLSVLIVEDDADKLRRVITAVKEVPSCDVSSIDNVRDAAAAKQRMKEKQYDLLILDIALPERPDLQPDRDGGIRLLDELVERDIFNKPRHIVGLTGYVDVLERAGPRFSEDLWSVIQYDPTSDTWVQQLKRKLSYIALTRKATAIPEHECYLCIITALQEPEMDAVLKIPWKWQKVERDSDPTIYQKGHFQKDGLTCNVVAASAHRMGMPAAAALAMKMITSFRPRYLAMVGILAGVEGRCELGDIIASDPVWDYGSGKLQSDGKEHLFLPEPYQVSINSFIRGKLSTMARDHSMMDRIRHEYPGDSPNRGIKMHIGPVASGASVVADKAFLEEVKKQHRRLLGIEMEAYGVLAAAEESPLPQPKAFAIKSVCDYADENKRDDYQHFSAYTSATALRFFVENYLS